MDEFEILVVHEPELLEVDDGPTLEQLVEIEIELLIVQELELLDVEQPDPELLEVAEQGPPGPQGQPGGGAGGGGVDSGLVKESVGDGETLVVPAGYQYLVYGKFEVVGNLQLIGKLVIL